MKLPKRRVAATARAAHMSPHAVSHRARHRNSEGVDCGDVGELLRGGGGGGSPTAAESTAVASEQLLGIEVAQQMLDVRIARRGHDRLDSSR